MTDWQPSLTGSLIRLRPLTEDDFESLYSAASDPQIWELHPDRERYKREKFLPYFRTGIESKGALVIIDQGTDKIIGSSRFHSHVPEQSCVEIGYTFLVRTCWGKGFNRELKTLMLDHAFKFVKTVYFRAGENNFRSRKALEKIGAVEVRREEAHRLDGTPHWAVVYRIGSSTA